MLIAYFVPYSHLIFSLLRVFSSLFSVITVLNMLSNFFDLNSGDLIAPIVIFTASSHLDRGRKLKLAMSLHDIEIL